MKPCVVSTSMKISSYEKVESLLILVDISVQWAPPEGFRVIKTQNEELETLGWQQKTGTVF